MSDVKCPYCGTEQEINHDDGYGYDEDKEHEQHCIDCDRKFTFTTQISYSYEVYCANHSDHKMYESDFTSGLFYCENCNYHEFKELNK